MAHPKRLLAIAVLALISGPAGGRAGLAPESGPGAPELLLSSVEIDDIFTGNASLWIEPGEAVDLKIKLYNDGNETAVAPLGALTYLGSHPGVTVIGKSAQWPDLPPLGLPSASLAPYLQLQVGSAFPCGLELPFRLDVTTGGGHAFQLQFSLRVGRRVDYDMLHDSPRRINEQESTLWGATGRFGTSVATGDINGDGYLDLLVGAAGDSTVAFGAGALFIVYGSADRWPDADLAAPVPGVAKFTGAVSNDQLGWSVAAGDLNGDGYDEAIVSATPSESIPGKVYVIYGKAAQWTDTDMSIAPIANEIELIGGETNDILGRSVATGDLNGDGLDDLIMSAYNADGPGNTRTEAGEVQIIMGIRDNLNPSLRTLRVYGAEALEQFGSVVGAADVNGDGFDDLIAVDTFLTNEIGQAFVLYGHSAWTADIDLLTPPADMARFVGPEYAGGSFGEPGGHKVIPTGDVNGDGYEDFVLSSTTIEPAGILRDNAGIAFLVYGRSTPWGEVGLQSAPDGIARLWGPVADGHLSGRTMGDLNGDGYDEIVLGANGMDALGRSLAGQVFVLPGRREAWADTDLADPTSGAFRIFGADANDNLGWTLATGDLDGDGADDLAAGVDFGDSLGNARFNAGEAYLWYGKATETYYLQPDSPAYIDATSGDLLDLACDDCSVSVPIGFEFPFYGEMLDTIHVSSNGFLSFAPIQDATSFVPFCAPDRRPDQSLIAPFWDDLDPSTGGPGSGVYTLLEGVAPNRRLTVEWKDVPLYGGIGDATFEVTLFETTGQILVQYQDLEFGDPGHDNGAAAVIGLENRAGVRGQSVSCSRAGIVFGGVSFRWIPTTPVVETDFEHGVGLWQQSGAPTIWGLSDGSCEPDSRSGETSWYFGFEPACTYDSGGISAGSLHVPTIPDFPADGRLIFWDRRQTESTSGFDVSKVQLSNSGTGGTYSDVLEVIDDQDAWVYEGVTSLFGNGGDTIDLRFHFDSVDSLGNGFLGWMVDDVQVVGCGAEGVIAAGAEALAFARPATYCEGDAGLVDAAGSFCLDTGVVAGYQWREDGADIPGATSVSYAIPSSQSSGSYGYSVSITCAGGAMDESTPAEVAIVSGPETVGATLQVDRIAGDLQLNWSDVAGADEYAVYSSLAPGVTFTNEVGTSPSGSTGLTTPVPPDDMVYYLVAGRNAVCGEGAQR